MTWPEKINRNSLWETPSEHHCQNKRTIQSSWSGNSPVKSFSWRNQAMRAQAVHYPSHGLPPPARQPPPAPPPLIANPATEFCAVFWNTIYKFEGIQKQEAEWKVCTETIAAGLFCPPHSCHCWTLQRSCNYISSGCLPRCQVQICEVLRVTDGSKYTWIFNLWKTT